MTKQHDFGESNSFYFMLGLCYVLFAVLSSFLLSHRYHHETASSSSLFFVAHHVKELIRDAMSKHITWDSEMPMSRPVVD